MKSLSFIEGDDTWKRLRKLAREDLYWFNKNILNLGDKIPMTEQAHYAMCLFAQRKTGISEIDECRVQMIQVPRGVGKSGLITGGRSLQRLITNRNWSIGIANESLTKAKGFLGAIKIQFQNNELLRALFPECIPDFKKVIWASEQIFIQRGRGFEDPINPSVLAVGAGSQTAGFHMHEWIIDDIISEDAAENAMAGHYTEIDKANRWMDRLEPLLKNPKRDPITIICTPWYLGDTYDYVVKDLWGLDEPEQRWKWIVELPSGGTRIIEVVRQGEIAIFKDPAIMSNGHALFPERYNLEELNVMRKQKPYFYQAQYMLEPSAADAATFNPEWLKHFEWSSQHKKQLRFRDFEGRIQFENINDLTTIISVDPAISDSAQAARSAIIVTATNGKEIFLLEAWAKRGAKASDLAQQVINFYQQYRPYRIIFEKVGYQEALAEVMELLAKQENIHERLPIYEHTTGSDTRKLLRIHGLEPYFKGGFFYYHPSQLDFKEEYDNFPNIRLKDLLDALSFQKEVWERLASRDSAREGGIIKEWANAEMRKKNRIRDRYSRNRHRKSAI